jgi:hypothetical protein
MEKATAAAPLGNRKFPTCLNCGSDHFLCGTGTSERFDDRGKQSGECHRRFPTYPHGRSTRGKSRLPSRHIGVRRSAAKAIGSRRAHPMTTLAAAVVVARRFTLRRRHRAGLIEWNTARLSPGRGGHGDRHMYASRSRFLPDDILPFFQCRSWPTAEQEAISPAMGSKVAVDIGARLRAKWRQMCCTPRLH